jgi:hypothetical protein
MSVSMLILRTPYLILDFFHRHAVGFLHVAAELADFGQQFLRHRRRTVHHQVGVRNAGVDFLDAVDGQDVAGGLARELVGAVRGADGDGQRVELGGLDEVGGLLRIGQQHRVVELAFGAVPSSSPASPVSSEPRQPSSPSTVTPRRGPSAPPCGSRRRCTRSPTGLAVFLQRAVHHHRREARSMAAMQIAGDWP